MSKVYDFSERLALKKAALATNEFMICGCQEEADEPSGYYPVIINDAQGVLLVGLVCPMCEGFVEFNCGRLVEE